MPKHVVSLTLPKGIPVGRVDVEFPVTANGDLMGRLKISKGGVEWLPAGNKVNSYHMTWEKLADLMSQYGT